MRANNSPMQAAQQRFESMVKALSPDIYRYAFSLAHNRAVAEDLVQETFMRAWRALDSLRDESKAKSWLMTTVRREHARLFERIQPRFDDVDLDQLVGEQGVDPEILALRRALAQLSAKFREVLVLQVLCGYTGAEIAELVGLPRATVNTRLFRARQQLRICLEAPDASNHGNSTRS